MEDLSIFSSERGDVPWYFSKITLVVSPLHLKLLGSCVVLPFPPKRENSGFNNTGQALLEPFPQHKSPQRALLLSTARNKAVSIKTIPGLLLQLLAVRV